MHRRWRKMRDVWIERLKARWLWIACGVLLALLAWIAVVQYRWINRVSDADQRRREELLERAVRDFRRDFTETLREPLMAFRQFGGPPGLAMGETELERNLTESTLAWRATANRPQLLHAVSFGVVGEDGVAVFKRLGSGEDQFTVQAWPEELARYHGILEGRGRRSETGPPSFARGFAQELAANHPVIAFPLAAVWHGGAPAQAQFPFPPAPRPHLRAWGFLEFDKAYLQTQLLPELMDRHFDRNGLDKYQLAIVTGQPPRILVQSDAPDLAAETAAADAAILADKFRNADARITLFGNQQNGWQQGGPEFPPPGRAEADRPRGRRGPPMRPGRPLPDVLVEPAEPDAWQLLVTYKSGSLAAAAERARRHNLAVSLGALLILAGSIALLALATQRSRRMAQQQMEFVAGVSHELRTPLAVIQSTSFNLARGTVTDANRVQQYGAAIQTEVRRLAAQVEQMLGFAGILSGRKLYDLRPVDAAEIVRHTLGEFTPLLDEQGWQVETHIADDLPLAVADVQALESALKNLIQNAMKYAAEGKWLGVRVEAESANRVTITIADHGAGIDPADLPHIFQPFYRGKKVLASPVSGAGLGLSLVERHIRAMRGRVTVISSAQNGTAFTLHLPAQNGTGQWGNQER